MILPQSYESMTREELIREVKNKQLAINYLQKVQGEHSSPECDPSAPETVGTWEERCAALYQVIGSLADFAGVFETSDDVASALDVACGRGDVENLLPWPKDTTHGKTQLLPQKSDGK